MLNDATNEKLESLEIWLYKLILGIPFLERVTNNEVLRRVNKEVKAIKTVKKGKLDYLGHIMRLSRKWKSTWS